MPIKTRAWVNPSEQPRKQERPVDRMAREFFPFCHWLQKQEQAGDLIIPLPPKLTNNSTTQHWRTKQAEKREYGGYLDQLRGMNLLPAPGLLADKVYVSAVMVLRQEMDDDNALIRCSKYPLDWLKSNGYLVDDKRKHCRWHRLPEQRIDFRQPPHLRLKLEVVEHW